MTHLKFVEHPIPESRKTKIIHVYSNHDETELGEIRWHTGWRQYVLNVAPNCIWSWDCLKEVSDFIKGLIDERKNNIIIVPKNTLSLKHRSVLG
jgi:hypothetical protein